MRTGGEDEGEDGGEDGVRTGVKMGVRTKVLGNWGPKLCLGWEKGMAMLWRRGEDGKDSGVFNPGT